MYISNHCSQHVQPFLQTYVYISNHCSRRVQPLLPTYTHNVLQLTHILKTEYDTHFAVKRFGCCCRGIRLPCTSFSRTLYNVSGLHWHTDRNRLHELLQSQCFCVLTPCKSKYISIAENSKKNFNFPNIAM